MQETKEKTAARNSGSPEIRKDMLLKRRILFEFICFNFCGQNSLRAEEQITLSHFLVSNHKIFGLRKVLKNLRSGPHKFAWEHCVSFNSCGLVNFPVIRLAVDFVNSGEDSEVGVLLYADFCLAKKHQVRKFNVHLDPVRGISSVLDDAARCKNRHSQGAKQ